MVKCNMMANGVTGSVMVLGGQNTKMGLYTRGSGGMIVGTDMDRAHMPMEMSMKGNGKEALEVAWEHSLIAKEGATMANGLTIDLKFQMIIGEVGTMRRAKLRAFWRKRARGYSKRLVENQRLEYQGDLLSKMRKLYIPRYL
mmetsp:Transcript_37653/g.47991  ORF Transcript_37653/g.47991 Transcript_37653/m.47991 type:complete len:142 (+) Transcript_37653:486-911(+)